MPPDASAALTRIKLRELQRQRDRLHDHYASVEEQARLAETPTERLRRLYAGLRQAAFAQTPLHPEADNLDPLFFQADAGVPEPGLIDTWLRRLETELVQGRLRAEVAYVFGRLLEESGTGEPPAAGGEPPAPGQEPWAVYWQDDPPHLDRTALDALVGRNAERLAGLRARVAAFGHGGSLAPVSDEEVGALLGSLGRDVYRQPALRRQASATRASQTMVHEYAGVLTILLTHLDEWDWPEEGVPLRPVWIHNKWRPMLDEDLLTALFVQLLGLRWGAELKNYCNASLRGDLGGLMTVAPVSSIHLALVERLRLGEAADFFLPRFPTAVSEWFANGYGGPGYGGGREGPDPLEHLLALVVGEIRFGRDLRPGQPLIVVQADLRDYYPRIPHAVLLALLEHLHFPPLWRAFFRRYLTVRARVGEELRPLRRGLTIGHLLSALLADLLLLLVDVDVYARHGVRLLRVVDDIYYLSESRPQAREVWKTLESTYSALGLEVNSSKSGSVDLTDANPPEGLPGGPPRWGLMQLHPDGVWRPDTEALGRIRERMRDDVGACPTVLDFVVRANDRLAYLLRNLAVRVALERDHLPGVGRLLGELTHNLFGPGRGLVSEIRQRIEDRFLDARLRQRGLPEALFYWPITAGGLALTNVSIHLAAFEKTRAGLSEPTVPSHPLNVRLMHEWSNYYQALVRTLAPATPHATSALSPMLADLINRGSKVRGHQQVGLSVYWQWVVALYGPQLLEALGTFRFLLTELVPLQLIHHNRSAGRAFGTEAGGGRVPRRSPLPGWSPPIGDDDIPF